MLKKIIHLYNGESTMADGNPCSKRPWQKKTEPLKVVGVTNKEIPKEELIDIKKNDGAPRTAERRPPANKIEVECAICFKNCWEYPSLSSKAYICERCNNRMFGG